jgi:hypothetical protein
MVIPAVMRMLFNRLSPLLINHSIHAFISKLVVIFNKAK